MNFFRIHLDLFGGGITSTELEFITVNKVEIPIGPKRQKSCLHYRCTELLFKISDNKCAWKKLVRAEFEDTIRPSEVSMYIEA